MVPCDSDALMTASAAPSMRSAPWSDRARAGWPLTGLAPILAVAAALVALRALVYLLFEQLGFDSDQAIHGLMAKHLSEGRAFPLFFYGQTYMLGVEAWAAVPFFWIGGPTVGALRFSLLMWNVAFGVLLVVGLWRDAGLRSWTALVPALFFLAAPPSVSKQLIDARVIIEPFVYIAVLWFLRRRPLWFGAVLAIGFRNREFTMYAVPVMLALELLAGELNRSRVRDWLLSMAMFFAVWESIEALMPFADLAGPGTRGQLLGGFSGSQIGNLVARFNGRPGEVVERVTRMGPALLAWFAGGAQVDTNLPVPERHWLVRLSGVCLLAATGRLLLLIGPDAGAWRDRSFTRQLRAQVARAAFAWYVLGVGAVAAVAFMAGRPGLAGYSRYAILGLLIPVGLTAAILALEPHRVVRRAATVLVIGWAVLAVIDNVRVLAMNIRQPVANPVREVADRLIERHVPVAFAGYWEAYVTTFIAQERVRVASSDVVRIQEYQDLFFERSRDARIVRQTPCPEGERVARWYLCSR
jgi:hypothetical protein